jgi:hypothetical protein
VLGLWAQLPWTGRGPGHGPGRGPDRAEGGRGVPSCHGVSDGVSPSPHHPIRSQNRRTRIRGSFDFLGGGPRERVTGRVEGRVEGRSTVRVTGRVMGRVAGRVAGRRRSGCMPCNQEGQRRPGTPRHPPTRARARARAKGRGGERACGSAPEPPGVGRPRTGGGGRAPRCSAALCRVPAAAAAGLAPAASESFARALVTGNAATGSRRVSSSRGLKSVS